jgi:non-canonical purine NTP pyrophosphatase, rdgB/HAM1 family
MHKTTRVLPTLIFVTGNAGKAKEVGQLLDGIMEVKSLKDIGFNEEIPEDHPTLKANAIQKARYIYDRYEMDCFAEDTGMEVIALNGAPGVYSARYAGPQRNDQKNMNLVLKNLEDKTDRSAQFRTVVALILNGKLHNFEGIVTGKIAIEKTGEKGFGYDPIFIPDGYQISFAEMEAKEKNKISHRGRAIKKLIEFLKRD